MKTNVKEFRIFELPDSMVEEVRMQIRFYSVTILIKIGDDDSNVIPVSGTLCKTGSSYGIITARHVWDDKHSGIMNQSEIIIPLRKGTYRIPKHVMTAIFPSLIGKRYDCSIPDIAFIQIPDSVASDLEAFNKVFYSLDNTLTRYSKDFFDDLNGYWTTFGSPNQLMDAQKRISPSLTYGTSIPTQFEQDDWDYLELSIVTKQNGMPKNVEGMSGGGIWRTLFHAQDFSIIDVIFSGVNFYQTDRSQEYRILGHGPKSVYYLLKALIEE